jgi:radical SAM superfamily enzyme YgiQ (UPF0313 family)
MGKNLRGLLIYPPVQLMKQERARPDGSLGLIYLASSFRQRGIETDILDASVGSDGHSLEDTFYNYVEQENGLIRIGMDFKDIANYVKEGNYNFVGINSNLTPQTKMAFETAKAIKQENPLINIHAGGVNARALKERFLSTGYFDTVCLTEGEIVFPKAVINGVENTPGFAYKDRNGNTKINPIDETCFPKQLDDLPMPLWEKLPLDKYEKISSPHGLDVSGKNKNRYAPIMTSRGCVWHCAYCHISTEKKDIGKLRTHSIERVVNEMDKLKSLGIEKLFFEDDTLLAKKQRVKEIFKRVKEKNFSIANVNGVNLIDFYNKDKWDIDMEYLDILRDAGYDQIVFPVESGSQRILDKYASGKVKLDKMNLPLLMREMVRRGIKSPVNIIIGFPDETEEEVLQSIDLGKKLKQNGAPYVSFFMPIPFPGSKLYDIAISGNYLDKNFDTDLMNWKRPIMKNTLIHPRRLEEIRNYANETVNDKEFIEEAHSKTIGNQWKFKQTNPADAIGNQLK